MFFEVLKIFLKVEMLEIIFRFDGWIVEKFVVEVYLEDCLYCYWFLRCLDWNINCY